MIKRPLLPLGLLLLAPLAFCQTARQIYLTAPDAEGKTLDAAIEVTRLAAQHGYNGVSLGIGIQRFEDPSHVDLSGVKAVTQAAMRAKLKYLCWRLDLKIPITQAWADKYNGGRLWELPNRPPEGTWPRIAQIWQAVRDTSAAECKRAGRDPSQVLTFVLTNEPGIGGLGGPSKGAWSVVGKTYSKYQKSGDRADFLQVFPEWAWGKPEGYIEPGFWKMLRELRKGVKLGARTYAVSYEGAESSIAAQASSSSGTDARWVFANSDGYAFNIFSPEANPKHGDSLAPAQAALAFSVRLKRLLGTLKSNPVLSKERILLTEFNISLNRIPKGGDPFLYRMHLLRTVLGYPGIDGGAMFTAYSRDPTSTSFPLFTRSGSTYQPIGSHAVGPAYLSMISLRGRSKP